MAYKVLLVMLREIVCVYLYNCVYELSSLLNINGKIARFKIKKEMGSQKSLSQFNIPNNLLMLINQFMHNLSINPTIKPLFSKNGMKFINWPITVLFSQWLLNLHQQVGQIFFSHQICGLERLINNI